MTRVHPDSPTDAARQLQGWALSLLLHGAAVSAGAALLAGLHTLPPPEPFQWEVSIQEPAPVQNNAPAPQPVRPQAQPQPAVQPEQPMPHQETVPPVQTAAEPAPTVATAPPIPAQPALAPVIERKPVDEAPIVASVHPTPAPSKPAPEVSAPSKPTEGHAPAPVASPPSQDSHPAPAAGASASSTASTKKDYGWLAETIWGRIEQLKRYPASARLNRWEGRVMIRAVVKEDGTFAELKIAQSSGHEVLDKDALALMKQAAPLTLTQPLGQPQVAVQIPISYTLR